MERYRVLARTWVYIDAPDIEGAIDKFNNTVDLGSLDDCLEDEEEEGIVAWEFHSVQAIEKEEDGTFKAVDTKLYAK